MLRIFPMAAALAFASPLAAQDSRFVPTPGGKPRLVVDGKPFLVMGIQLNNSSGFPAILHDLAPAIRRSHANTVMAPVGWESIEPEEGRFDFSIVDGLRQIRDLFSLIGVARPAPAPEAR